MPPPETSAAIVAGGQARRLDGQDKSRLVVRGEPIIVRQVAVLQLVALETFVVAPGAARFEDLGLVTRTDLVPGAGALGGIHTAVETASYEFVVVVACDLPFLSAPLLTRLVELAQVADGAWVRTPAGVEPLLACYRRSARAKIRAQIDRGHFKAGDLGRVLRMAEMSREQVGAFGPPEDLLANVNTPEDYARVQ